MSEEPEFYLDNCYSDYNPDDVSNWDMENPVEFMLTVIKDINQLAASVDVMREVMVKDIDKMGVDNPAHKMVMENMDGLDRRLITLRRLIRTAVNYRYAYVKLHPPQSTDDINK